MDLAHWPTFMMASPVAAVLDIAGSDWWSRGAPIALVGLLIVFAVLMLLSLFIASMPRILAVVETVFPTPAHSRHEADHPNSGLPDDAVVAAIGFVLHTEFQRQVSAGGGAESASPPTAKSGAGN